jgi:hypothetical protein
MRLPILGVVLAAFVLTQCGGGQETTSRPSLPDAASLIPVAPAPQPTATPLPGTEPVLDPLPARPGGGGAETGDASGCGEPLVGPDAEYCKRVGFSDGRSFCPVRAEGSPDRIACEAARVGVASDTGRPGPTWSANGRSCDAADGAGRCLNHGDNQYLAWAYGTGSFRACAQSGVCGEIQVQ